MVYSVWRSTLSLRSTQVSSANYKAREYGIRADMCIGEAKRLCPDLVVMPYQYDKYQAASEQACPAHTQYAETHLASLEDALALCTALSSHPLTTKLKHESMNQSRKRMSYELACKCSALLMFPFAVP